MRRHFMGSLVLCCALLNGCRDQGSPAESTQPDAVPVGFLGVISNPTNSLRWELGARLAVAEINAAGGVNGHPLQLQVSADLPGAVSGMSGARHLADQGCVALVGPPFSSLFLQTHNEVAQPLGLPLVSYAATSPALTALPGAGTLTWRTVPSDALQGKLLAQKVRNAGLSQAAIIAPNDTYGLGVASVFRTEFVALGGTLLSEVYFPSGKVGDFGGEVNQLLAGGLPQGILLIGNLGTDSTAISQEIVKRGLSPFPRFFGSDATPNATFLREAPAQVLDVLEGTTPATDLTDPNQMAFRAAYTSATGRDAFNSEDRAYDAVTLIAYAMIRGGANTRAAVSSNLRAVSGPGGTSVGVGEWARGVALLRAGQEINYEGASGRIDWDAQGDVTGGTYGWWRVVNRQFVMVETLRP